MFLSNISVWRQETKDPDLRRFTIQSNPHSLQLRLQKRTLLRSFRRIQHHKNEITRLRRRNNLSSSPLSLRSTLNNTRQIQNLNLGTTILQNTGDSGQSCERVGSYLAASLGDFG